jgi:Ca2+-binding RTX toxin-like protein
MMNEIRAGTSGDDMITAGNNSNVIVEHDGNDIINSGSEDDQICGGNGNDKINGEDGDNIETTTQTSHTTDIVETEKKRTVTAGYLS